MALTAWTPDKRELSTTPKLAELFSEKQQPKVELKSRDVKSKAIREPNETGETSEWLALKQETFVLELKVLCKQQKLSQLQAKQENQNFTPNEDNLQVAPEFSKTFASLQSQVPALSSFRKQEKQQKLDWPQDC